jgi:hypothetical protein
MTKKERDGVFTSQDFQFVTRKYRISGHEAKENLVDFRSLSLGTFIVEYAPTETELFLSFLIILQKLVEISRLKQQRAAGRQLELNQLEKIKKEDELLRELQGLVL